MITKKILKLLEEKYPTVKDPITRMETVASILIYPDESGRISCFPEQPYKYEPEFEFSSLKELVDHLKGE